METHIKPGIIFSGQRLGEQLHPMYLLHEKDFWFELTKMGLVEVQRTFM